MVCTSTHRYSINYYLSFLRQSYQSNHGVILHLNIYWESFSYAEENLFSLLNYSLLQFVCCEYYDTIRTWRGGLGQGRLAFKQDAANTRQPNTHILAGRVRSLFSILNLQRIAMEDDRSRVVIELSDWLKEFWYACVVQTCMSLGNIHVCVY